MPHQASLPILTMPARNGRRAGRFFLNGMEVVLPWSALLSRIEPPLSQEQMARASTHGAGKHVAHLLHIEQVRKLPRQVDSSEVEFFPASNRSRNTAEAGLPARHRAVLHCSFSPIHG